MPLRRPQGARSLRYAIRRKNAANDLEHFTILQLWRFKGVFTMRLTLAPAALAARTSVASAHSHWRGTGTAIRVWLGLLFALALGGAAAHAGYDFVAAPDGDDNGECTYARPCSPQGAVNACPHGQWCSVQLQAGLYLDPEVNIYYHRTISLRGNCDDPHAVIFRATKRGVLVRIQDHATGTVSCLTLEATAPGVVGISGRQHIIADYEGVIFGPMPEGTHIGMTEFSIASCLDTVWITGDAGVHARASAHSKLNLGCHMTLTEPRAFTHLVVAQMFSVVDANGAVFGTAATARAFTQVAGATTFSVVEADRAVGFVATDGACSSSNSIVLQPEQGFPGASPGNC